TRTKMALFLNHLIVDAVGAVFPFGSEAFVRLREQFWLTVFAEAARDGRSLIFTFAPEPTVGQGFADSVSKLVHSAGGEVMFIKLTVPQEEQERRLIGRPSANSNRLISCEGFATSARPAFPKCRNRLSSSILPPWSREQRQRRLLRPSQPPPRQCRA